MSLVHEQWDPDDPSQNNAAPPNGAPEGMQAASLNDNSRVIMQSCAQIGNQAFSTTADRTFGSIAVTGTATISGLTTMTNASLSDNQPVLDFQEIDGSLDNKRWFTQASNERLSIGTKDDAGVIGSNSIQHTRNGNLMTGLEAYVATGRWLALSFDTQALAMFGRTNSPLVSLVTNSDSTGLPEIRITTAAGLRVAAVSFAFNTNTLQITKYNNTTGVASAQIQMTDGVVNVSIGELRENNNRVYSAGNPPP